MNDMFDLNAPAGKMLTAIFRASKGDPDHTVGMWVVGQSIGLERSETESLAMDLVAEGFLEIKSLSGGVALTQTGLALFEAGASQDAEPVTLGTILERMETFLNERDLPPAVRQNLAADIQTLRAQSGRTSPLPAVLETVLNAVREALSGLSSPPVDLIDAVNRLLKTF